MAQFNLRQTNAYAMQYGAVFGLWQIATVAATFGSLRLPILSLVSMILTIGSFVVAFLLTRRFRGEIGGNEGFSIFHGFSHTLLMALFASIWLALFTYLYMSYADTTWLFDAYRQQFTSPEMMQVITESGMSKDIEAITGDSNPTSIVDVMEDMPPVTYAAMMLYVNALISPIASLIVGIACRKKKRNTGN